VGLAKGSLGLTTVYAYHFPPLSHLAMCLQIIIDEPTQYIIIDDFREGNHSDDFSRLTYRKLLEEVCSQDARSQQGRSRVDLHADGARAADRYACMRSHWSCSFDCCKLPRLNYPEQVFAILDKSFQPRPSMILEKSFAM